MRTDGATGPIARAVMESNRCDLAQEHDGVRRIYPCGYFWSDDAVGDGALTFRAYQNYLNAKERDERVKLPSQSAPVRTYWCACLECMIARGYDV